MTPRPDVADPGTARPPAASCEVGPVSRASAWAYRGIRGLALVLARVLWRIDVQGRDRLPTGVPYVVAPVHRSNLDFLLAGIAVPRRMRYMVKDTVWKVGWLGRLVEWGGSFPVDRENTDRRALRNAERALAAGDPVVIFPEGKRKEGTVVEDLYDGASWVACRNRVAIVPIGIGGADDAMPIGSKFVRPARVRVVIGEPIFPDVPMTGRVPRRMVVDTTERLRVEVQRLYDHVR